MSKESGENINSGELILLMISPEFMDSDHRMNKEVRRALDRHRLGEALVIPILIRPAHWDQALFGHLQPLPSDRQPVASWPTLDDAFVDVAAGVQRVLESL